MPVPPQKKPPRRIVFGIGTPRSLQSTQDPSDRSTRAGWTRKRPANTASTAPSGAKGSTRSVGGQVKGGNAQTPTSPKKREEQCSQSSSRSSIVDLSKPPKWSKSTTPPSVGTQNEEEEVAREVEAEDDEHEEGDDSDQENQENDSDQENHGDEREEASDAVVSETEEETEEEENQEEEQADQESEDENVEVEQGSAQFSSESLQAASRRWRNISAAYLKKGYRLEHSLGRMTAHHVTTVAQLQSHGNVTAINQLQPAYDRDSNQMSAKVKTIAGRADFCELMSRHIKDPVGAPLGIWVQLPDPSQRTALGIMAFSNELRTNSFADLLTPRNVAEASATIARAPEGLTLDERYKRVIASQWPSILQCLPGTLSDYLPDDLVPETGNYTPDLMYDCFTYLKGVVNDNPEPWTDAFPNVKRNVGLSPPPTIGSAPSVTQFPSQQAGQSGARQSQPSQSCGPNYPQRGTYFAGSRARSGPPGTDPNYFSPRRKT